MPSSREAVINDGFDHMEEKWQRTGILTEIASANGDSRKQKILR
jgi:hypothetical protein